jgi:hypothetical protein
MNKIKKTRKSFSFTRLESVPSYKKNSSLETEDEHQISRFVPEYRNNDIPISIRSYIIYHLN